MRNLILVGLMPIFVCCFASCVSAQEKKGWSYPPKIPDAEAEVYKRVPDIELKAYVHLPEGHQRNDRRGAIVFFFGGGWVGGTPEQFAPHCEYFAKRGMVAIACDYRVAMRQSVKPVSCVADAKSAVRWVRDNHARLGVDPEKVVAAGGSAGGHIAACTGMTELMDEPQEDLAVSSKPNAMALFNPVLRVGPAEGLDENEALKAKLADRFGIQAHSISPFHNVREGQPPTIIFHGTQDKTVPIATVKRFTEMMADAENRCELFKYEGMGHGFFNQGRNDDEYFHETVRELDKFLVSLDFLAPLEDE